MKTRLVAAAATVTSTILLAGCGVITHGAYGSAQREAAPAPLSTRPGSWWGVYASGVPGSYAPVARFAAEAGAQPRLVSYYSGWGEPFKEQFAADATAHGATTVVQIDPYRVSLAAIAAGRDDTYIRSYAEQVRAFRSPVIIGFGHEMNGSWYTWGAGRTPAAVFVAAWRHIVTVFRETGADNVTWLWTINALNATRQPLRQWWPGVSYVTWIGIDAYYYRPSDTFASVFASTLREVRRFSAAPALASETAIGPGAGRPERITKLFSGIRDAGLVGLIWFNQAGKGGIYHQDWRLDNDPAGLATFRAAVHKYAA